LTRAERCQPLAIVGLPVIQRIGVRRQSLETVAGAHFDTMQPTRAQVRDERLRLRVSIGEDDPVTLGRHRVRRDDNRNARADRAPLASASDENGCELSVSTRTRKRRPLESLAFEQT
jgi:hypothetical protein